MFKFKDLFAGTLSEMLGIAPERAKYLFQYAKNLKDKPTVEAIRMAGDYLQDEAETVLFISYLSNIKGNVAGQKKAAERFAKAAPTKDDLLETFLGKMQGGGIFGK